MARRPVISTSALSLTAPNYLVLLQSIQDLQGAESNFYEDRKNELNSYLGQPSRSTNEVESAYDSLLGTQPWEYTNIFNSAGNSLDNTETSNEEDHQLAHALLQQKVASTQKGITRGSLASLAPTEGC